VTVKREAWSAYEDEGIIQPLGRRADDGSQMDPRGVQEALNMRRGTSSHAFLRQ
jgi:hypothetical protein